MKVSSRELTERKFRAELLHAEDIHHMTAMDYAVMDRGSADVAALLLKVLPPPASMCVYVCVCMCVCVCVRERETERKGVRDRVGGVMDPGADVAALLLKVLPPPPSLSPPREGESEGE